MSQRRVLASYVLEEEIIGASVEDVYAYISDPNNLRDFAEQIQSVDVLSDTTTMTSSGAIEERKLVLRIVDCIFICYCFPKAVNIDAISLQYPNGNKDVNHPMVTFSSSASGVEIQHRYIVKPKSDDGQGVLLVDEVDFYAFPFLLKSFVMNQASTAHQLTMNIIRDKCMRT
eukprot:m.11001 g.11001  ORF g.11001 m.11001 type:complete len:172 (-) comp6791_c0_seq1:160-675(-)